MGAHIDRSLSLTHHVQNDSRWLFGNLCAKLFGGDPSQRRCIPLCGALDGDDAYDTEVEFGIAIPQELNWELLPLDSELHD